MIRALILVTLAAPAVAQDLELVSVAPGGAAGDKGSYVAVTSADGNVVVFESRATDLVAGDSNGLDDIYARNVSTGVTTRVSVATGGGDPNDHCRAPAVSADGRYVVFESKASNLVSGDTNGLSDVFLRDLQLGTTTRLSVQHDGSQTDGFSYLAAISGDGAFVAFTSVSSGMTAGALGETVIVRDLAAGTNEAIDVTFDGQPPTNRGLDPHLSHDGRFVVWSTTASNILPGDTNGNEDVYLRDRVAGTTERISVDSSGIGGNSYAKQAQVSADGSRVSFMSFSTNLVPGDTNGAEDVFLRDRTLGSTTRLSVDAGGVQGDLNSRDPAMTSDGTRVVFTSRASNLVPGDTNFQDDVFLRDLSLDTIEIVSLDAQGEQLTKHCLAPDISDSGRTVVFDSKSTPVAGDANGDSDVFRRHERARYFRVEVEGEVDHIDPLQPSSPLLDAVELGDEVFLSLRVDSEVFFDLPSSRSYRADFDSWYFRVGPSSWAVDEQVLETVYVRLGEDVIGNDGFSVVGDVNGSVPILLDDPSVSPLELPMTLAGASGSIFSTVDIADAVGTYTGTDFPVELWQIKKALPPLGRITIQFKELRIFEATEWSAEPYGCGVNPAGSFSLLAGEPWVGETVVLGVDNPLGTQAAGSLPFVLLGLQPDANHPCGTSIPGLGMAGPGAPGEVLITPGSLPLLIGSAWTTPGVPAPVFLPIPPLVGLVGFTVYAQGAMYDPAASLGVEIGLADALAVTFGG